MTVEDAVAEADARIRREPELAHTEHLVVEHGNRTVAAYAYGRRAVDEPGDVFSVTKSVLSTLVGCAVNDGRLELGAALGELLGAMVPEGARQTTVRHLLTMTGGTDPSGDHDIDAVMQLPKGWTRTLLTAPRLSPPGTRFRYDNGATHVLAACLARALDEDLEEYARRRLFGPLGITRAHWPRDPDGLPYGFGQLRLSALDLLALGRLNTSEQQVPAESLTARQRLPTLTWPGNVPRAPVRAPPTRVPPRPPRTGRGQGGTGPCRYPGREAGRSG
ncbi:serine hydrolase [Streptomyces sp. NPDC012466]|uniref:serine hydrolase domain-containing protein n=1 Tax=Streptomyces sp. NPDC012466 TaxID=3364835 RepID=UPI0036ECBCDD